MLGEELLLVVQQVLKDNHYQNHMAPIMEDIHNKLLR
jgi:hypothetical protein